MGVISYKCPACGGPLKWDAAKQKYSCEYCLSEFDEIQLAEAASEGGVNAEEAAVSSAALNQEAAASGRDTAAPGREKENRKAQEEEMYGYTCPSCGAAIVTDSTTAATFCYYCHNPAVLQSRLQGGFRPDEIIPFSIDRKKALEIFKDWIKRHRYVPEDFYAESQIEMFTGVYFPYWLFNGKVHGRASGTGDRVRIWTSGDMRYTETKTFQIDRDGVMPVRNISRIALNKASRVLCESVAPFEYEKMRPFSAGYLSGFMAENRDVERASVEPEILAEVKDYAKDQLTAEATGVYSNVNFSSLSTEITESSWKYVLLPVWTLTYKARNGKIFYFSINGTSGKTVGELPVDKKKLLGLFFMVAVPVMALVLAILWLFF